MAALTGAKTSEQAMADTSSEWERIVRRTGQDKIAEAIQASRPAWPTIIDPLS
jgi:multiple sugar transport system substrate-binding protein